MYVCAVSDECVSVTPNLRYLDEWFDQRSPRSSEGTEKDVGTHAYVHINVNVYSCRYSTSAPMHLLKGTHAMYSKRA